MNIAEITGDPKLTDKAIRQVSKPAEPDR